MSENPPASSEIGQLSPDGHWRWDGQAWQPAAATPLPAAPPLAAPQLAPVTSKRRPGFWRMAAVAIIALVVGGICGTAVGSSNQQSQQASSSHSPSAVAATATAPAIQSEALAYATVVSADAPNVGTAFTTLGTECSSGDMTRCRAAAVAAQGVDNAFLAQLIKLAVPACLAPANELIDAALVMFSDGAADVIAGIDTNDVAQITTATGLFGQGTTHLTAATAMIQKSPCG